MLFRVLFLFPIFQNTFSANILGVFLSPSFSHQNIFQQIWTDLSLRGHQVTVLTPHPSRNTKLSNLTEIEIGFPKDVKPPRHDSVSHKPNMFEDLHNILKFTEFIVENALNSPQFKNLISQENRSFDLILLECLNPVLYGLSHKFQAPVICVSSLGALTISLDVVNNPSHPILHKELLVTCHDENVSMWNKIQLVLLNVWSRFWYQFVLKSKAEKRTEDVFGEILDLSEMEKKVSAFFINVNPFLYPPRPNVPNVVELGLIHIQAAKALPKDLAKFLDDAKEGAIYFSLGTSIQIEDSSLARTIEETFCKLPYKIVMKWKCATLLKKSENILCGEWLPQQDILAHPNIKAFVTHGGLHSIEEAISRQVPMIGLPIRVDQPMNVQKLTQAGIGIYLDPNTITSDKLKNGIIEVAENPKYKIKIQQICRIVHDRSMTGLDKAVWWSEYVIRHKGAYHLRTDVSWISYLLLDVIVVVILGLFALFIFIYFALLKTISCINI